MLCVLRENKEIRRKYFFNCKGGNFKYKFTVTDMDLHFTIVIEITFIDFCQILLLPTWVLKQEHFKWRLSMWALYF